MRQVLLVLTSVITKNQSERALELRQEAATSFLKIICQRSDRTKVKPALQGLAHFLLRDVVTVTQLVEYHVALNGLTLQDEAGAVPVAYPEEVYDEVSPAVFTDEVQSTPEQSPVTLSEAEKTMQSQILLKAFLAWVVHHDTALSAGHLIKNYLIQLRKLPQAIDTSALPLWIEPVVQIIQDWPDRMREFKTHVFPHCFQPNISEYLHFLSYLHFREHVQPKGALPEQLLAHEDIKNGLSGPEEFSILLVAIATGKELTIIKDTGEFASYQR